MFRNVSAAVHCCQVKKARLCNQDTMNSFQQVYMQSRSATNSLRRRPSQEYPYWNSPLQHGSKRHSYTREQARALVMPSLYPSRGNSVRTTPSLGASLATLVQFVMTLFVIWSSWNLTASLRGEAHVLQAHALDHSSISPL